MSCIFLVKWLTEEFLPYLDRWEKTVSTREGFSRTEKDKMLLSQETRKGLRITGMNTYNVIPIVDNMKCMYTCNSEPFSCCLVALVVFLFSCFIPIVGS